MSIILILFFSLALRLLAIDQSLWLDEATSATVVRSLSINEILNKFSPADFHPPAYYLFLKIWTDIFGYSELAIRFPSLIFGTLTVYLSYLIGKEIFDKKVGLVSAFLVSTSGLHVYYSQEARMYAMAAFFVSLAFYSYIKILKKMNTFFLYTFAFSLATAIFTEYLCVLMVPVFFSISLLQKKNLEWWKNILFSQLPLVGLFILWLPTFLKQLTGGLKVNETLPEWWNILGVVNIKNILLIPTKFILGRVSIDNNFVYIVIVCLISLFYLFVINKRTSSRHIWIWLSAPIFGMILIGFFIPVVYYFRILFVLPAFFILISSGIMSLTTKVKYISLLVVIAINITSTFVYLGNDNFHRENWKGVVGYISSKDNDVIVFPSNNNHEAFVYYSPEARIISAAELTSEYEYIWYVPYLDIIFDNNDEIESKIENLGYNLDSEKSFRGIGSVYLYKK